MSYKRSIAIGGSLILFVIFLSGLTFYLSLGSCPTGSFACDNNTVCVPQRKICDKHVDCRDRQDEDLTLCGSFYGSKDLINSVMTKSQNNNVTKVLDICEKREIKINFEIKCTCKYSFFFCLNKSLTQVPVDPPKKIKGYYLAWNKIKLSNNSFEGLNNLEYINLNKNNISIIPSGVFRGLNKLRKIYLRDNIIEEIPSGTFVGLKKLEWLILDMNHIEKFPLIELRDLCSLNWLILTTNRISLINDKFPKLEKLLELFLDYNLIEEIGADLFDGLINLQLLNLKHNRIRTIHPLAFKKLTDLRELRLSENHLNQLPENILYSMSKLDALHLDYNNISISAALLKNCNVAFLNLDGINYENIDFETIAHLPNLHLIIYKKFYYCSMTPHILKCKPNTDGISTLEDLLSNPVLRYSAWLMTVLTCLGNCLVLWGRFTQRDENRAVSMVIRNLAVADMLMGFYLSIIGIQDFRYRKKYHEVAQTWVASWSCAAAGILAMISSEVSMLILAFMSIERFLLIADPFGGHHRMDSRNVTISLFTIWLIGVTIAIIPVIYWRSSTRFYGTYSGTCFPLHIQERFPLGWQYSAFVFLGINMTLLILIAILYTALLVSIWRTRRATPLAVLDSEFAIRFFFIVLTDATCWAPIIALKILAFVNFEISAELYAWIVVFILPLNSALNPLLYTFTTPRYRDKLGLKGWSNLLSRRRRDGGGFINSNPDESQGKIIPLLYTTGGVTPNWQT